MIAFGPLDDATAWIAAAREAAEGISVLIVVNARCDAFHLQHGDEDKHQSLIEERLETVVVDKIKALAQRLQTVTAQLYFLIGAVLVWLIRLVAP